MAIETQDYGRYIDEMLVYERKMQKTSGEDLKLDLNPKEREFLEEIHREENNHVEVLEKIKSEILGSIGE